MNLITVFSFFGVLVIFLFVLSMVQERSRKRKEAIQAAMNIYERAMRTSHNALQSDPLLLTSALKEVIYGRMLRAQEALRDQGIPAPKADVRQTETALDELHMAVDILPGDKPSLPIDDRGRKALLQHVARAKMFLQNEIKQRTVSSPALNDAILHVNKIEMGIHLSSLVDRGKLALDRELLGGARESFESAQALLDKHLELAEGFAEHRLIIEQNLQRIKELMRADGQPSTAVGSEDGLPEFTTIVDRGETASKVDDGGDGLDRMFGKQRTHWE